LNANRPRLVIVARHAQSEHHVRGLTGGWTDTPLTDLGHEQARRLAARLNRELGGGPIRLFSSDLQRAMQTAEPIAQAFGAEITSDARLREHNNGAAANLTIQEASCRFPDTWNVQLGIDDVPFEGAETGRQFYARSGAFIDDLPADGPIPVVVTHGGTVICLVGRWLHLTAESLEPILLSSHPTAITVLRGDARGVRVLERLNDAAHLDGIEGSVSLRDLAPAEDVDEVDVTR
jgi:probable phosphoglycerate mutase